MRMPHAPVVGRAGILVAPNDEDAAMKMRANGIDVEYQVHGEGPWVTLSHSLACNNAMWEPQIAALSKRYKLLRYDTRGHGGTTATPSPYTLDQLADDARALLDALGIKRTHWVGLSLGGMIGEAFALQHADRLTSLVLCDTTSRYAPEAAAMWDDRIRSAEATGMAALAEPTLGRWFTEPYRKSHPEIMKLFATAIGETPLAGYAGCGKAIATIDLTEHLRSLRMPTLVIVGEQDMGTPVAMAREIADAIPDAQLTILPSAAHLSNVEQAERFNDALLGFLDRNTL
jgi:3-oxoadipate enol-lactonase